MNDNLFLCSKISVDCAKNDPVDIKCGGPEYLGFDFFVKREDFNQMQRLIVTTLTTLEVPLISIYESEKLVLPEKDIWSSERIVDTIKNNCDCIIQETKNNHKLTLKK